MRPAASGSIYAIKDPYSLSDLRSATCRARTSGTALRQFTADGRRLGLRVIMDLVINHTAQDAVLVADHPEWYRRNPDGTLYAPRAVDPDDPTKVTIWEDLAELDYETPSARAVLIDYWTHYVRHYAGAGVRRLPLRRRLSGAGRGLAARSSRRRGKPTPGLRFFAETLGCTADQVVALAGAGFDYIFNSAKWWDFRAPWLLDQYEKFRLIAPSIAFPESHDTERLAAQVPRPSAADRQPEVPPAVRRLLLLRPHGADGLRVWVQAEARRGADAAGRIGRRPAST